MDMRERMEVPSGEKNFSGGTIDLEPITPKHSMFAVYGAERTWVFVYQEGKTTPVYSNSGSNEYREDILLDAVETAKLLYADMVRKVDFPE